MAIALFHGAPITRAGTGASSGSLPASERARFSGRTFEVPGSQAKQMFLGPSLLGVYRAIGIEAGIQFPVYRDAGPLYPKERYRFALNFAYFF